GDSTAWPFQLVKFLLGSLDEKASLAMGSDPRKLTEIHAFLRLRDSISGRPESAVPHFRWVKDHGVSPKAEHGIATAEVSRIEGVKGDRPSMRIPTVICWPEASAAHRREVSDRGVKEPCAR